MTRWLLAVCIIAALCLVAAWIEDTRHQRRQDRAEQAWQADHAARGASASGRRPAPAPARS
ncbi:hypothetical protein ACFVZ3_22100 [Kitasatospora purpeofusca]|uniref:hypothetical protein n=1 Tax=Kitasatospora purpeofusca TaxID=67352 RepID=UPI0036BE7C9B